MVFWTSFENAFMSTVAPLTRRASEAIERLRNKPGPQSACLAGLAAGPSRRPGDFGCAGGRHRPSEHRPVCLLLCWRRVRRVDFSTGNKTEHRPAHGKLKT